MKRIRIKIRDSERESLERKSSLFEKLKAHGYLKTPRIVKAFEEVNRELFVPEKYRGFAYIDEPIPLGFGQTISAPHMVAIMTELLQPKKSDKVLEVGSGSGYQAAILSRLVRKVHSVELDGNLVTMAKGNLKKAGIRNVSVVLGDGSLGHEEAGPYNKIIVTCAAERMPENLIGQLKYNGRLVAPIQDGWHQSLYLWIKRESGDIRKEHHGNVEFVPMRH